MGKLRELLPIINIFDWANGDKYIVEEDTTVLTPELAESDQKTDAKWEEHHQQTLVKGNGGKGKFKVDKSQLATKKEEAKLQEEPVQKTEREER